MRFVGSVGPVFAAEGGFVDALLLAVVVLVTDDTVDCGMADEAVRLVVGGVDDWVEVVDGGASCFVGETK